MREQRRTREGELGREPEDNGRRGSDCCWFLKKRTGMTGGFMAINDQKY